MKTPIKLIALALISSAFLLSGCAGFPVVTDTGTAVDTMVKGMNASQGSLMEFLVKYGYGDKISNVRYEKDGTAQSYDLKKAVHVELRYSAEEHVMTTTVIAQARDEYIDDLANYAVSMEDDETQRKPLRDLLLANKTREGASLSVLKGDGNVNLSGGVYVLTIRQNVLKMLVAKGSN